MSAGTTIAPARITTGPTIARSFLLSRVQPALSGLMDGSLSTLAPIFAVALATHRPLAAELRSARESVVIVTKGGLRMDGENLVRDASPAHLAESLGALDLSLSRADLAEIDRTIAAAVPVGGPTPEGMS